MTYRYPPYTIGYTPPDLGLANAQFQVPVAPLALSPDVTLAPGPGLPFIPATAQLQEDIKPLGAPDIGPYWQPSQRTLDSGGDMQPGETGVITDVADYPFIPESIIVPLYVNGHDVRVPPFVFWNFRINGERHDLRQAPGYDTTSLLGVGLVFSISGDPATRLLRHGGLVTVSVTNEGSTPARFRAILRGQGYR